jgi:RNA polymerase sigma-70 factor (ECF subfamily)
MDAIASETEIERLLAHSAWLSALARRLVRDPSTADDLVQDTWQAALRAPKGSDRGWLGAVIANLARARSRSEFARRGREQCAAVQEGIDGPGDLVERAESQRNLLAHVLALEEPYRSTLLARYVEGRSAAAIARRTGVNESTVRTRLSRALEQLRARLASEHRADPRLGLGALLAHTGGGAIASAARNTLLGASIVSTATKLALAAGVLLCAWFAWSHLGAESVDGERTVSSARPSPSAQLEPPTQSPQPPGERQALPSPASASPAPTSEAAAPDAPKFVAKLDITFTRDGLPVPGISARLVPELTAGWFAPDSVFFMNLLDARYVWPSKAPQAVSDAHGIASFRELRNALYFVGFNPADPAGIPTHFALSTSGGMHTAQAYEIRLGSGAVHGTVFDDLGRPRQGVGVLISGRRPDWHEGLAVSTFASTDARGAYRLTDLRGMEYDVVMEPDAHFDGRGEIQQTVITLKAGEDLEVDFGSPNPGPRWTGRLLNTFDEPFPGTPRLELERVGKTDRLTATVDDAGKFHLAFTPGTWRVRAFAAGAPEMGFDLGNVELPNTDFAHDLIVPGTRLQGRVSPLKEGEELPTELFVAVHPKEHFYSSAIREGNVYPGGHYQIDGLEPGTWVIDIWPGTLEASIEVEILAGTRTVEQDLRWRSP